MNTQGTCLGGVGGGRGVGDPVTGEFGVAVTAPASSHCAEASAERQRELQHRLPRLKRTPGALGEAGSVASPTRGNVPHHPPWDTHGLCVLTATSTAPYQAVTK